MSQEHEKDATAQAVVKPGMGYPNHRDLESPSPIGWQGLGLQNIDHVSRETSWEAK